MADLDDESNRTPASGGDWLTAVFGAGAQPASDLEWLAEFHATVVADALEAGIAINPNFADKGNPLPDTAAGQSREDDNHLGAMLVTLDPSGDGNSERPADPLPPVSDAPPAAPAPRAPDSGPQGPPDLSMAAEFLHLLDATAPGWTFQTFDDSEAKRKPLARVLHGSLAGHTKELADLQASGAGVYVTVNETDLTGRKAENVVRVRAFFVDLDGAPLGPVRAWLEPHIIVESSSGRWHAYWLVSDCPLEEFKGVQKRLIAAFGADTAIHDLPRVLRLPGFWHLKEDPAPVMLLDTSPEVPSYTLAEFEARMTTLPQAPSREAPRHLKADPGPIWTPGVVPDHPMNVEAVAAILCAAAPAVEKAGGYNATVELVQLVGDYGLSEETAVDLMMEHWAHRCTDPWEREPLAEKLRSLWTSRENPLGCRSVAMAGEPLPAHIPPQYVLGPRGKPIWCAENARQALERHGAWENVWAYDEFNGLVMLMRPVPGTPVARSRFRPRQFRDSDVADAVCWFNRNGFPDATKTTVWDAIVQVAWTSILSPVRHYLEALEWDGKPRLGKWLTTYLGADPSPLTASMGQAWMISAVARALEPGCKADCALVLEGPQGGGKSSALAALAGPDWFHDGLPDLHSKDAAMGLRGKWIIELAELSALRRSDIEATKAFLSRTTERFRPPYGRGEVTEPRRCIFAGTTNRTDYLMDDTGGRRFWPVGVGAIDLPAMQQDRDQLWAEAVHLYRAGHPWWLNADEEAQARLIVADRQAEDPWSGRVLALAEVLLGEGACEISTTMIIERMGMPVEGRSKADAMRVAGILTRAGWRKEGKFTRAPCKDQARYVPPKRAWEWD